jgi:hypothetical protein
MSILVRQANIDPGPKEAAGGRSSDGKRREVKQMEGT